MPTPQPLPVISKAQLLGGELTGRRHLRRI
jgi:hypothetical protein